MRKVISTKISELLLERFLRLCPVHVCRLECLVLLDIGVVPNLIPTKLLENLGLKPQPTRRNITVASGQRAKCKGLIRDVPVWFEEVATTI